MFRDPALTYPLPKFLAFNMTRSLAGGSGGGSTAPLRFAAANNYMPSVSSTDVGQPMSGTLLDNFTRLPFHLAGAATFSELRLCAYWFSFAAALLTNGGQIVSAALEIGGTFAPVTWGGSRNLTMADGATDQLSDAVTATALGFPSGIPAGTKVYVRVNFRLAAAGNAPSLPVETYTDVGGFRSFRYDRNAITGPVGPVDATGETQYDEDDFGVSLFFGAPWTPVLVGRASSGDVKSFAVAGDSIAMGQEDTAASPDVFGMVGRAMWNAGRTAPVAAMCNFGWSGTSATVWTGAALTRISGMLKYARYGIDEYGTNSIVGDLAGTQTNSAAIWAAMRAQGITHVIRTKLLCRVTPGTGWPVAEASQTVVSGWAAGQNVELFNTWLGTQVGQPTGVTTLININSVRGTNVYKWLPTATGDGLHLIAAGAVLAAAEINAAIVALP